MKKNQHSLKDEKNAFYSADIFIETLICSYFIISFVNLLIHTGKETNFFKLAFLQEGRTTGDFFSHCITMAIVMALLTVAEKFLAKWKPTAHLMVVSYLLFAFTALLKYDTESYFFCLALLFVAVLVLLYATDKGCFDFINQEFPSRVMWVAVAAIAIGFGFFITAIGVYKYLDYYAPNFDFGLFCNMFYNMKKMGLPYVTSERDMLLSHFAVHFSPIYYLMLPFYFVFPSPITLSVGQAVIVYSGIIPLVLLAKNLRISQKSILVFSVIYAAYPALSGGCLYDLHENCFLLPLLLWMFYFFEKEKYVPMAIFAILTLTVKEDAFIYLVFFAMYLIFSRKKWKMGLIYLTGSILYFAIVSQMMRQYGLGIMDNRFSNLIYNREDGLFGALKTMILNPGYVLTQIFSTSEGTTGKLLYLLQLFLPLAFLPFATKRMSRLILCAPVLLNIITMYIYQSNIGFQYSFGIAAFLFYSSLLNTSELKPFPRKFMTRIAAVASVLMFTVAIISKYTYYANFYEVNKESIYSRFDYALGQVLPKNSSVAASTYLIAHIADRDAIFEVKYHKENEQYKTDTEFIALDMRRAYAQNGLEIAEYYYTQGYSQYYYDENVILILKNENFQ